MTPRAQAFYDGCCEGREWDVLASLSLDLDERDMASYGDDALCRGVKHLAQRFDPYRWTTIQPQIDKQIASYREGVRDHYEWRNPFGTV